MILSDLTNELIQINEHNAQPNWINYLICMTVGVEAIPIGYLVVIGPVFILTKFAD